MEHATLLLALAAAFGLFMAWGIGANDVANAMATSVGSRALTLRRAILIAAVFEFLGAYLAGGEVTATISQRMVDAELLAPNPELLVYGMLASLLAAGCWLFIASRHGLPVSTTHSIVGAIVGFAAVGIGVEAVHWNKIGSIVMSWIISPLLAGFLAFALFRSVQFLILDRPDPFACAKRWIPAYVFFTGLIISLVTLFKGLRHVGLHVTPAQGYVLAVTIGLAAALLGQALLRRLMPQPELDRTFHYRNVERVFGLMMIFTACAMAFAHGSNDVANAVGPVAAVYGVIRSGTVQETVGLPPQILLLGAAGIVFGLVTYGYRVIATVGTQITDLTPSRGFCCEIAAATTVVVASGAGIPISTTHTLVGAVLGVGLARGISALNLRVIGTILTSWIVTLPAGAVLAIVFFWIIRSVL
jgi:PiT family inorganic phosphate transporter